MIEIEKLVSSALNGDIKSKEKLKEYYKYLIDKYSNDYNIPREIVDKEYNRLIDIYLSRKRKEKINYFLYRYLLSLSKPKVVKPRTKTVIDLFNEVKEGNLDSREKLILRYAPVVYEVAKLYDYMEYEDLVQYGLIKLIEIIDGCGTTRSCLGLTGRIKRDLNLLYNKMLKNILETTAKCDKYNNTVEQNISTTDSKIEDVITLASLRNDLDKLNLSPQVEETFLMRVLDDETIGYIAEYMGVTDQAIESRLETASKKFKSLYLKMEYKEKRQNTK